MSFLWNLLQEQRINANAHDATMANRRSLDLESRCFALERQIEGLSLAFQALYELTSESQGITQHQLTTKMQEIDARDGVMDNRYRGDIFPCPKCGHPVNSQRDMCLYCGKVEKPHANNEPDRT